MFGQFKVSGKSLSLKYRCRTTLGLRPGYSLFSGYYYSSLYILKADLLSWALSWYWTCLKPQHLAWYWKSEHFFLFLERKCGIYSSKNDSEMLNVSLRRPPLHTCSSNKDPLSHIYFSTVDSVSVLIPNRESSCFFIFFLKDACTPANYKLKIPVFSFELVILLFKKLVDLVFFFLIIRG